MLKNRVTLVIAAIMVFAAATLLAIVMTSLLSATEPEAEPTEASWTYRCNPICAVV